MWVLLTSNQMEIACVQTGNNNITVLGETACHCEVHGFTAIEEFRLLENIFNSWPMNSNTAQCVCSLQILVSRATTTGDITTTLR
jgi:hypothetical protein